MDLIPGALTNNFVLTLSGIVVSAPDVDITATMSEQEVLRTLEGAGRKDTSLATIVCRSTPGGVMVSSDIYTDPKVVEVLSAVVARIARLVMLNEVRDADR